MAEGKTSGPSGPGKGKPKTAKAVFERPRGGEARAVSDLVPDIGRAAFRRFGFVQSSVVSRWDEIVGPRYADVTAPEMIRFPVGQKAGGTLELVVESGHAVMIQHVLPEIVERVNRFFGYEAVAKVKLRQGMVQKVQPKTRLAAAPVCARRLPNWVNRCVKLPILNCRRYCKIWRKALPKRASECRCSGPFQRQIWPADSRTKSVTHCLF